MRSSCSVGTAGEGAMREAEVVVFDVNGTLLSTDLLEPLFERVFGDRAVLQLWFARLLLHSQALTLSGAWEEFGTLGGAVLRMLGQALGREVGTGDVNELAALQRALHPYPDVPDALRRLRAAGFRLAVLTNSSSSVLDKQLAHAELDGMFEQALSVEEVRRYKPAPETYRMAAERLGVPPSGLCLVAAHAWDCAGAVQAGCAAALVLRPGQGALPAGPQPDLVVPDLSVLANELVAGRGTPAA